MPDEIQLKVADFGDEGPVFYDHETRTLRGSQYDKARKLVALGLVERTTETSFLIRPIPGYNTRTYIVEITDGNTSCNCQFGNSGRTCSHILSVILFLKKNGEWHGD